MESYLKEIQEELSLLNSQNNNERSKQYRILNQNGEIFTLSNGWQPLTGKVYGHIFDLNELQAVKGVLIKHGFDKLHVELDKAGTAFTYASNSPFGNPGKMVKLLLFTVFFFVALYIILQIDPTSLIKYFEY